MRDHDRIRGVDRLRFADGGSDDPIAGAQMRGKAAGDAETDHAAITLPDSGVGHVLKFAAGGAANYQHAGTRGDTRLEGKANECNDEAPGTFDRSFGDLKGLFRFAYQFFYESSTRIIQLGCH